MSRFAAVALGFGPTPWERDGVYGLLRSFPPGTEWEWRQCYPGGILVGRRDGREVQRVVDLMSLRSGEWIMRTLVRVGAEIDEALNFPPLTRASALRDLEAVGA